MPYNLLQHLYKIPAKARLLIAIIVSLITFAVSGRTAEEKDIKKETEGGLEFPMEESPDYLDFAYFSFVIGMTFQVSDVQITSRQIRHLALFHGFISFVYNTVILALSITIISGLVQK